MSRPSNDRDGACICDYGPNTDGPQEDCPFHGRPYAYWIERGDELQARAERAEQQVAAVRALAEELLAEVAELRADIPPVGPSRIAHIYRTAGLSDAHDRIRAALDTGQGRAQRDETGLSGDAGGEVGSSYTDGILGAQKGTER